MSLASVPFNTRLGAARRAALLLLAVSILLAGCAPRVSSPQELAAFNAARPIRPEVDVPRVAAARRPSGPYRVVAGDVLEIRVRTGASLPTASVLAAPARARTDGYRVVSGDVLQFQMPAVLKAVGEVFSEKVEPYQCRVREGGSIWLPTVGELKVAGKPLEQIESAVVAAYYPKLVKTRPAVIARVADYKTLPVSVVGAVAQPGRYELRSDEMSLLSALTRAGGIAAQGAGSIRIQRPGRAKPVLVPLAGRGVPQTDVPLEGGDIVEVAAGFSPNDAYTCRVSEGGSIRLPIIGEVKVAGSTLAEIESLVAAEYWPKFVSSPPVVAAGVTEYRTSTVSVTGGVVNPGRYELRSDEMSLISLLMKAGGITREGAAAIRIRHAGQPHDAECTTLPVTGLNIPSADVALVEGDVVEVERLAPQVLTVLGLVRQPGTFPYPPCAHYGLTHALALAGGVDAASDPQYASIYRKDAQGNLVSVCVHMGRSGIGSRSALPIEPGDIILIGNSFPARVRAFFSKMFRTGFYAGATYRIGQ